MFSDEKQVFAFRQAVQALRSKLRKVHNFEFKFSKLRREERLAFLKLAANFEFKIRAIVFNKALMADVAREYFKGNYYRYALRSLLNDDLAPLKTVIKIDTFGEYEYRQQLKNYFVQHLTTGQKHQPLLRDLVFEDSKYDDALQLADLVAGGIRKSFENQQSSGQVYRQILATKEDQVRVFTQVLNPH